MSGSSPRLRGTVKQVLQEGFFGGAVHPRACGERLSHDRLRTGRRHRFIPAPAGNGCCKLGGLQSSVVGSSPRLRGTDGTSWPAPPSFMAGSSPRLRGTAIPLDNAGRAGDPRFIPAPAGNGARRVTPYGLGFIRFIPAPAGNGSSGTTPDSNGADDGSSPRLRGTGHDASSRG